MQEDISVTDALPSLKKPHFLKKPSKNKVRANDSNQELTDAKAQVKLRYHEDDIIEVAVPIYRMNRPNRGKAIIINNENFHQSVGLSIRRGTDADAVNLKRIFQKLGFETVVYKDVNLKRLHRIFIDAATRTDHEQSDCFVAAFLSHGDDGILFATDGMLEIKRIVDMFRGNYCPSLAGKPKIFLFQACRGRNHEDPVTAIDDVVDGAVEKRENEEIIPFPTLPCGSDFLFGYSVAEGFFSHRDTLYGSWYIQELNNVMDRCIFGKQKQRIDFLDILTIVNYNVARRRVEHTKHKPSLGKKQMPCFLSLLTKKLYLEPK